MKNVIILVVIAVAVVLAIGLSATLPYFLVKHPSSQGGTNNSQGSVLNYGASQPPYDCAYPAIDSDLSCATLPPGYNISPKLPGSPPVVCPAGMTSDACSLLQKTEGNGVCDPNETPFTAPLDCNCPGALSPDPYTGRCASPATVCQAQAAAEVITNSTKP
jgi:hypothetical protein